MAVLIPPTPIGSPPGSAFWNDWFEKIRTLINSGTITSAWTSLNFASSNITDIVSRAHNNLQSFQGGTSGEYYHLTSTQHTRMSGYIDKATDPTTSDIASGTWAIYRNTTSNTVKLWANKGGTMVGVALT